MPQGRFSCNSCGKRVEYGIRERPCEVLRGWVMVSEWKDVEAVEHYYFCSLGCLKTWVEDRAPRVPEVFLKAFEEDDE